MKNKVDLVENKSKILTILVAIILVITLIGTYMKANDNENNKEQTDAINFKEEYESLNGTYAYNDIKFPKVSLIDENPFVYKDASEVVETLKNGTGIIYLGFPKCPWCRNAVNVLQYVNVDEIIYLDMSDVRDTYELVNGSVTKTKDGSKEYYEMLDLLNDILMDYELENDGVKYQTGEKRIYVPLVVGVKEGKIVAYHMDTVTLDDGQTAFDLLTKKQQEDLKDIYDDIKAKVYDDMCDISLEHGC